MHDRKYTFIFAIIVCLVCSLSLSIISQGLKSRQILNEELDVKKNILKAVKLEKPLDPKAPSEEIIKVYNDNIEELVVNANGDIIKGEGLEGAQAGSTDKYPMYIYREENKIRAYCFPISGKGLWSTIYGYMALESDVTTVRGISFYKHGETPGLGAEVAANWFQDNFQGKRIRANKGGPLVSISVVKGKVEDKYKSGEDWHYVDGISGATITSRGVTAFLEEGLLKYEPFFKKISLTS